MTVYGGLVIFRSIGIHRREFARKDLLIKYIYSTDDFTHVVQRGSHDDAIRGGPKKAPKGDLGVGARNGDRTVTAWFGATDCARARESKVKQNNASSRLFTCTDARKMAKGAHFSMFDGCVVVQTD